MTTVGYTYDRRASTSSDLAVHVGADGKVKVYVDGQQVGLLTSVTLASFSSGPPKVRIGVLEGANVTAEWDRPGIRSAKVAREVIAKLRRVPHVEVVCPDYFKGG